MLKPQQNCNSFILPRGLRLPGIARKILFNSAKQQGAEFAFFDKKNKDFHDKIKASNYGGISQIFNIYHKAGETQIRGGDKKCESSGDKKCESIKGFDVNALYLAAISAEMPEGLFVRRRAENDFSPEYRDHQLKSYHWLNYLKRFENKNIQHARNSEKK